MKNELNDEKVAIVVYHTQPKHTLPDLMPTTVLTDKKYRKYGCLVDFFYTPMDKIYSCCLNKDAVAKLRGYLKRTSKQNESSNNKGKSKTRILKNEKDSVPGKGKANKLQMYYPNPTKTGDEFRQRLCERFKRYSIKDFEVSFELPLIVLVQYYSGLGTDIATALTDIPDLECSQIAIVVFKVQAEHALPKLYPTKALPDDTYRKFGCIVVFCYTPEKKMYRCSQNEEAEKELEAFLKQFVKKRPSAYTRAWSSCKSKNRD